MVLSYKSQLKVWIKVYSSTKHFCVFKHSFKLIFVFSVIDLNCVASLKLSSDIKNLHRYWQRQKDGNVLRPIEKSKSKRKKPLRQNFVELSIFVVWKKYRVILGHPVYKLPCEMEYILLLHFTFLISWEKIQPFLMIQKSCRTLY